MSIKKSISHGLMGSTGAGKSTLLQHLNGLIRPQSGKVIINGHNLADPATDLRKIRRMVGLVFQIPESQIFEQYVGDEIAYGPRLTGLRGDELRQRVRWAMDIVGLDFESTKDRPTFALSGGEKRKVALASLLAINPAVLLLDEPTAGLDPASRHDILRKLRDLQSSMTLVISSHQMEDLAVLVDNVTVLSSGSVAMEGNICHVFSQNDKLLELGLDIPVVTQTALKLNKLGWQLPVGLVRDEQLAELLKDHYA
jgi:energy-coupling factor transport system ATP-binding protein